MRVLTLADHWFARCRVLGLACPRNQSAARPCERGAGNRRGGGQLRWAMVALARAIIALELACSSSAVTLPAVLSSSRFAVGRKMIIRGLCQLINPAYLPARVS